MLIKPLEIAFELFYSVCEQLTKSSGIAIILLSLLVNLLSLPLYRRADFIREKERGLERKLFGWSRHIKRVFKGDERFLMLRTLYRQNGYRPLDVFRGAIPLLLQIPFFLAAYRFLSALPTIKGVSFGMIPDLGSPDGLMMIAGVSVNALPIIMTVINIIAGMVYTHGKFSKESFQLYAMALIFLVLLYNSPAGLTLYWTCNNLFSLIKNLLEKQTPGRERTMEAMETGEPLSVNNVMVFLFSALFLMILIGVYIPSTVIVASPEEFTNTSATLNPASLLIDSAVISIGLFLIWGTILYLMSAGFQRRKITEFLFIFCFIAIMDFMFFDFHLGTMNSLLLFYNKPHLELIPTVFNLICILTVSILLHSVLKKWAKTGKWLAITGFLAVFIMSILNVKYIVESYEQTSKTYTELGGPVSFELSKTGKNVVVFMLDRAIGDYIPYIFNEKRELYDQFDGFTWYPNSVSFGSHTNTGAPGLFGGYEYIPSEMNKHSDRLLVDKHNEAIRVMPVLFDDRGYEVTVCDIPYGNYRIKTDLSVYNDHPDIRTYNALGKYNQNDSMIASGREFFLYGVYKAIPTLLKPLIYQNGTYGVPASENAEAGIIYKVQKTEGMSKATGLNGYFMDTYNVLKELCGMTRSTNEEKNTFLMFSNETPHERIILREPEYEPELYVDNSEYDREYIQRFSDNGSYITLDTLEKLYHYHINAAALLKIGDWLDLLKQEGIYDNTRIIIVSDHGNKDCLDDPVLVKGADHDGTGSENYDMGVFHCLLMVKDFGSHGFTTDKSFMTNADVPSLATDSLITDPVNPFTGKKLDRTGKDVEEIELLENIDFNPDGEAYRFNKDVWFSVHVTCQRKRTGVIQVIIDDQ